MPSPSAALFGNLSQMLAPHNFVRTLQGAQQYNARQRQLQSMEDGIKDLNFRATKDPALKKRISSAKSMFPNAMASPEEFARFSSHLQEGQMAEEMVDELEQNGLLGSSGLADFYRKQATLNPSNAIRDMHSFAQGQEAFALRNAKQMEAQSLADAAKAKADADAIALGQAALKAHPDDMQSAMAMIMEGPEALQGPALRQLITAQQVVSSEQSAQAREDEAKAKAAAAKETQSNQLEVVSSALRTLDFAEDELVDEKVALDTILADPDQMDLLAKAGIEEAEVAGFIKRRNEQLSLEQARRNIVRTASDSLQQQFAGTGQATERGAEVVTGSEAFPNALVVQGTEAQGNLPDLGASEAGEDGLFGAESGTPAVVRRLIVPSDEGYYNVIEDSVGRFIGFGVSSDMAEPKVVQFAVDPSTQELKPYADITEGQLTATVKDMVRRGVQKQNPDRSIAKAISKLSKHASKMEGAKDLTTPQGALVQEIKELEGMASDLTTVESKQRFVSTGNVGISPEWTSRVAKRGKIYSQQINDATTLATRYMILLQKLHALERGAFIQGE